MSLFPLFAFLMGVIVFDTLVIMYLYVKYREAKYDADRFQPPF